MIINHDNFNRNMDMLLIDTDFTDGIDSANLYNFLKSIDQRLKDSNCQVIFTMRDDRSVEMSNLSEKSWIRRILTDADDGYLFEPRIEN